MTVKKAVILGHNDCLGGFDAPLDDYSELPERIRRHALEFDLSDIRSSSGRNGGVRYASVKLTGKDGVLIS